jgi:hypothetical protein
MLPRYKANIVDPKITADDSGIMFTRHDEGCWVPATFVTALEAELASVQMQLYHARRRIADFQDGSLITKEV